MNDTPQAKMIDPETVTDLLERVETLESQVGDLQDQLDDQTQYDDKGIDHRDAAVLDQLGEGARLNPRSLVTLYLRHTDITNRSTATNRAKTIASRSFFDHQGGDLVFTGVSENE